jgi:UDP-glucose 4-epimerase
MSGRRLVLTGARGMVGNALLRHFHDLGWHVTAACSGAARGTSNRVSVVPFDLGAQKPDAELEKAVAAADAVIHSAALLPSSGLLKTPEGAHDLYHKNSQGSFDLMALAARHGVGRFVFLSSANLYSQPPDEIREDIQPTPSDAYMLSKLAGEDAAAMFGRASHTRFYALRIAAPYGAGFTAKAVIPIFVTRALAGQPLELMGSGGREQVFTYVRDIASACEAAITADAPSGPYNIAGPGPATMTELAQAVKRAVGGAVEISYSGVADPNEGAKRRISISRASEHLGWQPRYDLDRGLTDMVTDIRNPPAPLLQTIS